MGLAAAVPAACTLLASVPHAMGHPVAEPALVAQDVQLILAPTVLLVFVGFAALSLGPIRRLFRLAPLDAQREANVLLTSALLVGFGIWIADALVPCLMGTADGLSFWELAVTEIPAHSLAMRELVVICALIAGLVLSRGAARHARLEKRLEQINRNLRATSAVNQLIARESQPQPLLQGTCDVLTENNAVEGAWIVHTKDVGTDVFHTGTHPAFARIAGMMSLGEFPSCVRRALETPSVSIIESTDSRCLDCVCRSRADTSALSVRIEHRDHVFGVFSVIVPDELAHSLRQHEILLEIAANLGAALSAMRMRAQQQILQGKYQAAMASTADAVIAFERDGRVTAWNPGAESLLGYRAEDMLGAAIETIVPDAELERHRTICLRAIQEKSLSGLETRRLTRDGRLVPVEMSLSQGTTRTGDTEGFVAVLRDISERKRTEAIQRRQLRMIRELADASSVEALFTIALETAVELAGMEGGAVYRRDVTTGELSLVVSQGMTDPMRTAVARFAPDSPTARQIGAGRPVYPCTEESQTTEDAGADAALGFIPVFHKGEPVAALCTGTTRPGKVRQDAPATLEMIAGEMGAAYARLQLSDRLRESESRFGRLLESVGTVAVQGYDPDGIIHYWNHASERLYGYTADEAIGKDIVELIVPTAAREETRHTIRHAGETGETPSPMEMDLLHKTGHTVPVYSSHAAVQTSSGMELYCIDVDLTDIRKLEEQLRQSQKMESVGQLAGGVAHDFNNLLQVINGSAELVLDALPDESAERQEIAEIAKAGKRAAQLVSQLLLFSRRQIMQPTDLNLNDVVGRLLKMLGRLLGEHIQLEFHPGNAIAVIHADRGMLEQLIMNLAVNSRDAMPNGGLLTIATRNVTLDDRFCKQNAWAEPGDYVQLNIVDTGAGMSSETLQHVFEPFFTTKEVGKGTGLGLATAHGIIKQHNGLVHVVSETGQGTTFSVYLPAGNAALLHDEQAPHREVTGGSEAILLAEDDPAVCRLATKVLEKGGYAVTHAEDGLQALELLEQEDNHFDLLVLDVVMPRCGGYEVYRELQRRGNPIPTLFATGYSEEAITSNFVAENNLPLVQKPFSPDLLLHAVRDALDAHQTE